MSIKKISNNFIEIMNNQENFFRLLYNLELTKGIDEVYLFLNHSEAINKNFILQNSNFKINIVTDVYNKIVHKSLNRVSTKKEYIDQIITSYNLFKKRGEWQKNKKIVKTLIAASKSASLKSLNKGVYL